MDEQDTKKHTHKKDKSTRPLSDPAEKIQHAKEESRPRHSNGSQSERYMWGLSWYEFLTLVGVVFTVYMAFIAALMQRNETISNREKERARIVTSGLYRDPDLVLSFSLRFKNVGETTALNTYGAWLQGECPYTSSGECVEWCLQPIEETERKGYGPLASQDEYIKEFSSTLKVGKARKTQRPIYFCGYFAYTDFFCVWRRKFYALSYDPATDQLRTHAPTNDEEEAQIQDCSPWRLYQ